jgi:hypothetical protein
VYDLFVANLSCVVPMNHQFKKLNARNIPSAVSVAPAEDEQVILKICKIEVTP